MPLSLKRHPRVMRQWSYEEKTCCQQTLLPDRMSPYLKVTKIDWCRSSMCWMVRPELSGFRMANFWLVKTAKAMKGATPSDEVGLTLF